MLNWIRRLWPRGHRTVYCFHDGTKTRYADPLVIAREVERLCPEYTTLLGFLAEDHSFAGDSGPVVDDLRQQQKDTLAKLVKVAREVFGVQKSPDPLMGFVLTEAASFKLLGDWLVWMSTAAEDARPFSNWPSRASPSMPPDSPTGSSAGSGSIEKT
ncbi:hypothetical protein J8F10_37405 [Gemmata sp. G18]|uniref:Uncharacterized protein n=1 Tax=Gemmata palustris TaxID=2822762 RepID=A0ABS5C4W3_9BACT|nr:hypothetical protein [Gemmata palustris]MBP3954964.1 hypothetical protein [Gemmata palustris]MBP3960933.1 hypothetical protein [Gemmata palustris]